ncbi:MAG: lipid A deacylase LpxR family protein [Lentisphaeria bacterium]|nr:lipid A deacylase LpxR family protein [Lentisphaeria bacterium]
MLRQLSLIILIVFRCLQNGAAETDEHWQTIVQFDNDLLTGTDDGYTNGARVAFARQLPADSSTHNFIQNTLLSLTGAERDDPLSNFRFPDENGLHLQYGIGLSQLMFTPKSPVPVTPPPGERPYAGWLGLEFSLQASVGDSAGTATVSIGATGRHSYAGDTQKWVHQNISDSPVFQGWDSQVPTELTVNVHLDHKQRLTFWDKTRRWPIQVDGFYEWGMALGNLRTDAYLGALIRVGYNLRTTYASPRVQLGSFTEAIFENDHSTDANFSLYGFAGLRGYAVLHDITLDGPLFHDWDESVNSEPWVGEFSFGIAARWHWAEISLSHTLRSDEFEDQRNLSRYGSVLLRLDVSF